MKCYTYELCIYYFIESLAFTLCCMNSNCALILCNVAASGSKVPCRCTITDLELDLEREGKAPTEYISFFTIVNDSWAV